MIRFSVAGRPVSKNRALRAAMTRGGRITTYRTPESRQYQALVAWIARTAMIGVEPLVGPVAATLTCWLRDRRGMPDADGIAKAVLDGCNGIVFGDDRQVCDLRVRRIVERGCEERVEIEVEEVDVRALGDGA